MSTAEVPAFTVPLAGVDVGFRSMSSGQLIMMQKILRDARKQAKTVGDDQAMVTMIVRMLDIIETTIISEDDVDHVAESMVAGKVNIEEILLIMRQGKDVQAEPDDDADPVDKPRANKARTKKA